MDEVALNFVDSREELLKLDKREAFLKTLAQYVEKFERNIGDLAKDVGIELNHKTIFKIKSKE